MNVNILQKQMNLLKTCAPQSWLCLFRQCQIGILLSVNSSLTNLGTYSQKQTKNENTNVLRQKTMNYLYI